MAKKVWNITLDGKKHVVELEHGYWSGKREILVDGKKLKLGSEGRQFVDVGSVHNFKIDGHSCIILINSFGIIYTYDLIIDGISQKTGKKFAVYIPSTKEIRETRNRYLNPWGYNNYTPKELKQKWFRKFVSNLLPLPFFSNKN